MTTEEKAKAYDEAVERAKGDYIAYKKVGDIAGIDALTSVFPQLTESEDERIRKAIGLILIATEDDQRAFYSTHNITRKECSAWLEKQKDILEERAKNITANMLEDGIEGIQRELIEFLSNTVNASWVDIIRSADAYAERIRNIIEKQKEQKPVARENDFVSKPQTSVEILRHYLVWAGNSESEEDCPYTWKALADAIRDGIKALEEQKPSTEETELNSIAFLEQMGYTCIPPGAKKKS